MPEPIRVALIGCGGIATANHLPALGYCPQARLVALCDTDPDALERMRERSGVEALFADHRALLATVELDAVIIATPNAAHAPIAIAAAERGLHVMCEKPLATCLPDAEAMLAAAQRAGVRHMTAFTYRFVPALRYLARLADEGAVGQPMTFRARRLFDNAGRYLGWRQHRAQAGYGVLADLLSHRIDLAHRIVGPITAVSAELRTFCPEREGRPADVDDWCALTVRFAGGAAGTLEGSRVATGWGTGKASPDIIELTGSEATLYYTAAEPHQLLRGVRGEAGLAPLPVPESMLTVPGTARDPHAGDPQQGFRYDQTHEFISAIVEGRECVPSFADGLRVQQVMEAALPSRGQVSESLS